MQGTGSAVAQCPWYRGPSLHPGTQNRSEMTVWAEDSSACPDLPQPLKMGAHEPCCSSCRDKNKNNYLSQTFWAQILAQSLHLLSHRLSLNTLRAAPPSDILRAFLPSLKRPERPAKTRKFSRKAEMPFLIHPVMTRH